MTEAPAPTDLASRWYFNQLVDLEVWLPSITTDPEQDGQDNRAYAEPEHLVCGFAKGFEPRLKHGVMMAASKEMLALLRECLVHLPASEPALRQRVDDVIGLVDGTPDVELSEVNSGHVSFGYEGR